MSDGGLGEDALAEHTAREAAKEEKSGWQAYKSKGERICVRLETYARSLDFRDL